MQRGAAQANGWTYFISHKQSDSAGEALELTVQLGKGACWLDVHQRDASVMAMENGVRNSQFFVCILSPGYLESKWCMKELEWAFTFSKPIILCFRAADNVGAILRRLPIEFASVSNIQGIKLDRSHPDFFQVAINLIQERVGDATGSSDGISKVRRGKGVIEHWKTMRATVTTVVATRRFREGGKRHTGAYSKLYRDNIYNIPSLPIPALKDSVQRILDSTLPLCTPTEASAQQALWTEFLEGVGAALQDLLLAQEKERAASSRYPYHYFENHWDDMYNGSRDCAPINFSPFFGITNDKNPNNMDQCKRAGAFVSSFAKWSRVVLSGNLKPDTDPKGDPMCSSAFHRMFGTAKIPTKGCDVLAQHQHESTNVVVLCNGHVFNVPVVYPMSGSVLNADACATLMRECVAQAATPADTNTCAQVMTTAPRDTWASVRAEMESNTTNKAALSAIDKALIVVCLDTDYWQTLDDTANALLMGPCTNRWYDKHCLIVDTAGHMGICFEHSYSDGTHWGRFIRDVMMDVDGKALLDVKTVDAPIAQPNELAWANSASLKLSFASAKSAYEKLIGGVACKALRCDAFGKDQCKTWKMGPDAVAQMVYQIVYRMMHGKMAATYEACATRKFFHGRTETIRTVTPEGKKLVEAVAAGGEVKAALEAAAAAHVRVSRAAASGLGCDRHLMALGKLAAKKGVSVPALTDKVTARSKDWLLSTSNGSQPYIDLFGFGPVTGEGYGIGYLIDKAQMSFCVTSFKGASSGSSASVFASNICSTMKWMREMQDVVAKDGSEANVPALKLESADLATAAAPQSVKAIGDIINAPGRWDVFISHTQKNANAKLLALDLFWSLKDLGLTAWLDVRMEKCDKVAMREGVQNSTICVAIISDGNGEDGTAYFERNFCKMELQWAVEAGVFIQPVIDMEDKKRIGEFIQQAPENFKFLGDINFLELYRGSPNFWKTSVNNVVEVLNEKKRSSISKMNM